MLEDVATRAVVSIANEGCTEHLSNDIYVDSILQRMPQNQLLRSLRLLGDR